jgi:plastocyanin
MLRLLFLVLLSAVGAFAQEVERTIEIGTLHGQLRYDKDLVGARAGSRVRLIFKNTDEMQHNLVILRPGAEGVAEVAQAALLLGTEAVARNFVPDHPRVLFHTKIINPQQSETIEFTVPAAAGDYPYVCTMPGHSVLMKGILRVGAEVAAERLASASAGGDSTRWHLHVHDAPLVARVFLEDSPSRSIAVGLPSGLNYCFDAGSCTVLYAWTGMFLDASRDREKRGGGICKILGQRFNVGSKGFPLRFGRADAPLPAVRFGGYRRSAIPHFLYSVEGTEVDHAVKPADGALGVTHEFTITRPPGDVYFTIDPSGLKVAASAGTWDGGTLHVPAASAGRFSVTLTTEGSSR